MDRSKLRNGLAVASAAIRAIRDFDEEKVLGEHLDNAEQALKRAQDSLRSRQPIVSPESSTPKAS